MNAQTQITSSLKAASKCLQALMDQTDGLSPSQATMFKATLEEANARLRELKKSVVALRWNNRELSALCETWENQCKQYKSLCVFNPDGVFTVDRQGFFTASNSAADKMSGYSANELRIMHFTQLCAPDHLNKAKKYFAQALEGHAQEFETAMITWDGKRVELFVTIVPIIVNEMITGLYGIAKDITTRKQIEDTRQSRLKYLFDTTPAVIYACEASGDYRVTFMSDRSREQFGYEPGLFLADQKFWIDHIHPDDRSRVMAERPELFKRGQHCLDYRFLHRDGSYRWTNDEMMLVSDENGAPIEIVGLWMDISERKQMEEELRESEEKYRTLVENAGEAICTIDKEGVFLFMNSMAAARLGGSPEDFIGKTMWNLFPQDVSDRQAESVRRVIESGQVEVLDTLAVLQGEIRWCNHSIAPLRDSCGQVMAALIVSRDITEKKRADEERSLLAQQRQLALDAAHLGWWRYDPIGNIASWDERYKEIFQVADNHLPYDEILKRLCPDDLPRVLMAVDAALNPSDPQPYGIEYRINLPDGTVRWVEAHGAATFEGDGDERHATSFVGTVADITERKLAEEALRASEEKYHALMENMNEVVYSMDARGVITYISPQMKRYDLVPEDIVGNCFLPYIHSDDRARIAADFHRSISTGAEFPSEFRLITKTGETCWFEDHGRVQREPSGEITGLTGVLRDITEHKKADEEIARLASIVESSDDAIYSMTLEGVITSWNAAAEKLFGYKSKEIIGESVCKLIPNERHNEARRILEQIIQGDHVAHFETVRLRKNRLRIHVSLTVSPIYCKSNQLVAFSSIVRDISERLALEQAVLEVSSREHRRIGQELHDSVGQSMTGLGFMARSLAQTLETKSYSESKLGLRIAEGIESALGEIRAIVRGLIPVEVDADGLRSALEELAISIRHQYDITCTFEGDHPVHVAANETATQLYRIAQEAVTNAIKHGKVSRIRISLVPTVSGDLILKIQDDGIGIQKSNRKGKGTGLQIMRHRASLANGTLSIEPVKTGGTLVTCILQQENHHRGEQNAHPDCR